ncbi:hypothetical protein ACFT4A_27090 [Streptomyces sp. NPDC057099]|uniref:hypothetical protein n=1 Tax=Streptomyces sp. NPDC057099 TaxID=3346019 RepID=UPI0036330061
MHRHGRSPESEADARAGHPHRPLLKPHEDGSQAAQLAAGGQLTPDAAMSLQRTAGNAAFLAVQRMPQGGNGEGPAEEKPMDGLSRLRRANARAEKRGQAAPTLGQAESPFGAYTVNKGRGAGPYITSNVKHQHPGSESLGTTYEELVRALDAEHLPLVAQAARSGAELDEEILGSMDATQRRAATMLYGIMTQSEERRFPGAGKAMRSALAKQGDPYHEAEEFDEDFPMAKEKGAQYYREVLAGKKQLSDKARKNLEDMSSSSSDGEKSS